MNLVVIKTTRTDSKLQSTLTDECLQEQDYKLVDNFSSECDRER